MLELDNDSKMVKQLAQTKIAIYFRKLRALKGPKLPRPLIPPPLEQGWNEHHAYPAYYGRPDGRIWSAKVGKLLKGNLQLDGYSYIKIDGKNVPRSRFNLSLALGRAIREGFDCDHIVPVSRGGGDDWVNLQELTRKAHGLKTALDNPDAGKKSGITRGVPIIAIHAATRFTSVNEARKTFGINVQVIARSLKGLQIRGDYVFSHTPKYLAEQADLPGEMWLQAVSSSGLLPKIKASDRGRIQDSRGRRSYGTDSGGYKKFNVTTNKNL
jgi:hypothetical protein